MNHILVIEDEIAIAELIQIGLTTSGYQCDYALDGEQGADFIETQSYDLILLDIMLPKINGYELMEYIEPLKIPIIFLTAKGTTKDKVKGLHMGAEDYIVKPFEMDELLARIEVVLRRYGKSQSTIQVLDVTINTEAKSVKKDDELVNLTPKEYDLLLVLVRNKNIAMYRDALFEKVWESDFLGDSRTLDLHIQRLRKKLDWKDHIKTVFKIGYILEA